MEFLQIQYYAWHPSLDDFLFDTEYRIQFRETIKYFQVFFVLQDGSKFWLIVILYVSLVILLIAAVLVGLLYKKMKSKTRRL